MSVAWITHKSKKILVTEYKGLTPDQMIDAIKKQAEIVKNEKGKVLLLDDFRGSYANAEFMDVAKDLGKNLIGPKTIKNAILGVDGIKGVLLRTYNIFTKYPAMPFKTREEALDFLTED